MIKQTNTETVLELINISKSFPGVKALDNVSLKLKKGSVLALVGENGAGKSTLIKIITGVFKPDGGEIRLHGQEVRFDSPHDTFAKGISVVHQERNLCDTFTVTENMFLERITEKSTEIINIKHYHCEAQKYLDIVGLNVSPTDSVDSLRSGQQQLLEIARALSSDAKIIMLDEPTASISINEAEVLLKTVENLRDQGYSIIFVSHKLEEVFRIADNICVIRDGKNAGESSDFDREELIFRMVGRAESKKIYPVRDRTDCEVVLEAKEIVSRENPSPYSFKLHRGDIYGWYGLVGAGRTELAQELIGIDPVTRGAIEVGGKKVSIKNPKEALEKYGIVYISENRNEEGVFVTHDIVTNISSSIIKKISGILGWVNRKKECTLANKYIDMLQIKTPSLQQYVVNLSGGNRQKVSVAKGLATDPQIVIIDEPTVGIDIKTKDEIHDIIWKLANDGISIILISSDLNEMVRLADRITVFNNFKICAHLSNTKDYTEMSKKIMRHILDHKRQ
ncbi:MAG: sugar ABC transporter ATP-binding protein [Eubacteriales bacterium]|nr:sugar ABC transporter ATP-binding protein [Eubacteriales bacterium]